MVTPTSWPGSPDPWQKPPGCPASAYRDPAFLAGSWPASSSAAGSAWGSGSRCPSPDVRRSPSGAIPLSCCEAGGPAPGLPQRVPPPGAPARRGAAGRSMKALTCPYHGWIYGLDGQCASISSGTGPSQPRRPAAEEGYGLVEVATRVWLDVVFVDLSGRPRLRGLIEPLGQAVGRAPGRAPAPHQPAGTPTWPSTGSWSSRTSWTPHLPSSTPRGARRPRPPSTRSSGSPRRSSRGRNTPAAVARKWSARSRPSLGCPTCWTTTPSRLWSSPIPSCSPTRASWLFAPSTPGRPEAHLRDRAGLRIPEALGPDTPSSDGRRRRLSPLINDQDLPILARLQATRGSGAVDRGRFVPARTPGPTCSSPRGGGAGRARGRPDPRPARPPPSGLRSRRPRPPILEVRGLRKATATRWRWPAWTLVVPARRVHHAPGPRRPGKTNAGPHRRPGGPHHGRILIDGVDATDLPSSRRGLASSPRTRPMPHLTIFENVAFPSGSAGGLGRRSSGGSPRSWPWSRLPAPPAPEAPGAVGRPAAAAAIRPLHRLLAGHHPHGRAPGRAGQAPPRADAGPS